MTQHQRTFTGRLRKYLRAGLRSNEIGDKVYNTLLEMFNLQPQAQWFNQPVTSASGTASVPGAWEWAAGAECGRINVEQAKVIERAHLHVDLDATTSGTVSVELWRNRGQTFNPGGPGTMTLLANVSHDQGEGDASATSFVFISEALRDLEAGDYLHMQALTKMSGGNWRAFVDVHYEESSV